ncbi:anti-sigma factor family protein [Streptomyces sp. S6]
MTSTTDTTGHPDVAELSDLTEGLLTPSRSAELHRHLDDCDLCSDTHASLEEIRSLLGTFAEPVTMPDDVAQRIDAALAAEAAAPLASAEAAVSESAPSESTPLDVSRETEHETVDVSRETSAADRPSGRARATTGPGRKDKSKDKSKDRPRPRRRTAAVIGVFTAAALGLGSVLVSSLMNDGDNGTTNTAADTFSKSSLPDEVAKLFPDKHRTAPSFTPKGEVGIQGNGESPKVLQAVNVPACVQQGTARTDDALATKPGVYKGKDVLLVVFPDTSDAGRVDAYLVDTDCVKDPAAQADVLFKATYTRP